MKYLKRIRNYELVAFATGFALMAYELAGSRILSPVVGSSTYVWTSIIGVIVAALSLGYALGGVLADKRVKPLDVAFLLLASGFATILTVVTSQPVLDWVAGSFGDARVQGLVASLVLFMPTSFLLGMISPYLARLRTESVATTGTSIAGLSALNAIGGILGTFCTGFIFFGYLGSNQSMVVVGVLLISASWLVMPKHLAVQRLAISAGILAAAFSLPGSSQDGGVRVSIDTPSAHYTVQEGLVNDDGEVRGVRYLLTGRGSGQSGIYTSGADELMLGYTQKMSDLVDAAPKKRTILMLGGGALTLPRHLAYKYPDAKIDVVEIDPKLTEISARHFKYDYPPNVTVIAQDARTFLNSNSKKYDIVLVDVYSELAIPFSLSTREFGKVLGAAVNRDGAAIINIIGSDNAECRDLLRALHASYAAYFNEHRAYPVKRQDIEQRRQNIISVYAHQKAGWLPQDKSVRLSRETEFTLTDNFAPVERLMQQCTGGR
jgi:spermidine synthase